MPVRVELSHVSRAYGDRDEALPVLRDINVVIEPGELAAVLGPSGCGKSTLLRLAAGLDHPSAGQVTLDGNVVRDVDPRCAVVFQEPRLLPWRTVASNIALGVPGRDGTAAATAALGRVGLEGFGDAYPHQLSGGMAQRAALARALVRQPDVLLLDEPFAALDALTRLKMQDVLVESFRSPRPTVMMVTHDVDEALRLADRIIILGRRPASVVATLAVPRLTGDITMHELAISRMRAEILAHFGIHAGQPRAAA